MDPESKPTPQRAKVDVSFRHQYETLRSLLFKNGTALQLMSDLEADLNHLEHTDPVLWRPLRRLLDESLLMAQELNLLSSNKFRSLYEIIETIRRQVKQVFQPQPDDQKQVLAIKINAKECVNLRIVGGKARGLATLNQHVPDSIPDGFVVTTAAHHLFMEKNNLIDRIRILLSDLDWVSDRHQFKHRTVAIRQMIQSATVPTEILDAIRKQLLAMDDSMVKSWAVRSSALSEDEQFTFAGQFDSLLHVAKQDLEKAYRNVLASRFSDRAILYRLHNGIREVETSMAVLFMPMIEAQASGVLYTTDPKDPTSGNMVVCAVTGLADKLVRGEQQGDIYYLTRMPDHDCIEHKKLEDASATQSETLRKVLTPVVLSELGRLAFAAVQALGFEMDIEWVIDKTDKIWLLQGRRLQLPTSSQPVERKKRLAPPLFESGYTLFPGRTEGPVVHLQSPEIERLVNKGAIAVIQQGTPEFSVILPHIAGLLIRYGGPVGHLAALVREFSVPCLYGLEKASGLLSPGEVISIDATKRRIYRGSRWTGLRQRVLARIATAAQKRPSGPLYDLVLALNLTDPWSSDFKAKNCNSVHDVIRFIHEMSVRSMFSFGDRQNRFWKKAARKVESSLPMKLKLVDLDGSTPEENKVVTPDAIHSRPFQALWRGISDERISWRKHSLAAINNVPPAVAEQVFGGTDGPRRPSDSNYLIVAADYLNLNARFAYHYAMLDAIVGLSKENNHVHFRFMGGGANNIQRLRRTRFIEKVLHNYHFGVDRRQDMVNAWLRHYPCVDSENALAMLGRLMACVRQLDMFLSGDSMTERLVEKFLNQEYSAFS